ncbi:DsbC family protein [Curvibacter sp. APW13]|uniref:DsbC family protein n=1 Tax=Curvibacter sp. APW13 TaxID=3077236 RepID=UPI0028DE3DDA|nr:DsbC family protein [Curvibacter sp. APW13]MDT8991956.1 DsbC family protein [Curvibacter sp. APW13]
MQNTSLARRTFTLGLIAAAAGTLVACSKNNDAPAAAAPAQLSPAQMYDKIAAGGKGFTVGAMMSANTVYVMFDPQCPHCGHLWEAAKPLLSKVKFVWVPVAIINPKSSAQGAALLASDKPLEAMTAHEASILAGTGGMTAMGSVPAEIEAAVKANTAIFNELGLESVPFVAAKNGSTGAVQVKNGAMETPVLSAWLGL